MKIRNLILLLVALLVSGGAWIGRAAWRAHLQIVSLDVRNAPLGEVLAKIQRQTRTSITVDRVLEGRITLHVKNKPLAYVLDRICEQAGARWSTLYAVYSSSAALNRLHAALTIGTKIPEAGWTQLAPKAGLGDLPEPDPLQMPEPPQHDFTGPPPQGAPGAGVMFRRSPNGQVFIEAGGGNGTESWSPEELVVESVLTARLGAGLPTAATASAAAEAARKVGGKWTTCLVLKKSIMGIGFASPSFGSSPGGPLKHNPNERFARLTPEQRVLQARQRGQMTFKAIPEQGN